MCLENSSGERPDAVFDAVKVYQKLVHEAVELLDNDMVSEARFLLSAFDVMGEDDDA